VEEFPTVMSCFWDRHLCELAFLTMPVLQILPGLLASHCLFIFRGFFFVPCFVGIAVKKSLDANTDTRNWYGLHIRVFVNLAV